MSKATPSSSEKIRNWRAAGLNRRQGEIARR
jgi:hypothetical protein